jgi:hypothetical protein
MAENEPIDMTRILTWPAAVFEEFLRWPDTMRQWREMQAEQIRLMRNMNDASEVMLRVARRLENADLGGLAGRVEAVTERMRDVTGAMRAPFSDPARIDRMEESLDEIRERMASLASWLPGGRSALRAFDAWRTPPAPSAVPVTIEDDLSEEDEPPE